MRAMGRVAGAIDWLNFTIGRAVAWIALLMVVTQLVIVVLRYVFGIGFVWLQESVVYMHALLFLLGAGYTLLRDGHVRVDIFYREASPRTKAWVNLAGVTLLLIPVCLLILYIAWPYVVSSWSVREGSREASGIPAVYLLKSVMLMFAGLLMLQGLSLALRSIQVLAGHGAPAPQPPHEGL